MLGFCFLSAAAMAARPTLAFDRLETDDVVTGGIEAPVTGLREAMEKVIKERGYAVETAEELVFGSERSGRLRISGRVGELSCDATMRERTCVALVWWEVYDARWGAVVLRGAVEGRNVVRNRETSAEQPRDAVVQSLNAMLSTPAFEQAAAAAVGPPKPTWGEPLGIRACGAGAVSLPARAEDLLDAVVLVRTDHGTGSGVVVSSDGFVATAAHVVGDRDEVGVQLRDGPELRARVVRVDPAMDLAVVRVDGRGFPCRPLATSAPGVGDGLWAVGAPLGQGLGWSVSAGVVSAVRQGPGYSWLQTDASLNPGNSGGPLFDDQGRVAGVVSWKVAAAGLEGLGFGVPATSWADRLQVKPGGSSAPLRDDQARQLAHLDLRLPEVPPTELKYTARPRRQAGLGMMAGGGLLALTGIVTSLSSEEGGPLPPLLIVSGFGLGTGGFVLTRGPAVSRPHDPIHFDADGSVVGEDD